MRRTIAALAALFTVMQAPDCQGTSPSGDLNHPDVEYTKDPLRPQPTKKRDDRQPTVSFRVVNMSDEPLVVTWKLGSRGDQTLTTEGTWEHTQKAAPGEHASLVVEQRNGTPPAVVQCSILVDGRLVIPGEGQGDPYMHRNDGQPCKASLIIP